MLAAIIAPNPLHGRSIWDTMEGTGIYPFAVRSPMVEDLASRRRNGMSFDLFVLVHDGIGTLASFATKIGEIRSVFPSVPIMAVTVPESERFVVSLLLSGADDVVSYPLRQEEFVARAWALTRRARARPGAAQTTCSAGPYTLKRNSRSIEYSGMTIDLTEKEFELTWLLFDRVGETVSRTQVLEAVWRLPAGVRTRCVDTCIATLRRKLRGLGGDGIRLIAVYGVGYRMEIEASETMAA